MSVIHDSLIRISKAKEERSASQPFGLASNAAALKAVEARPRSSRGRPWFFPLIVFAVMLAAASLIYAYEHDARMQAETKLTNTLNDLSDARAQVSEITRQKKESEKEMGGQIETLQSKLKNVTDEKESLVREKQALEFDNLSKEKTNSRLTGQVHRVQMDKLHLSGVIKNLRRKTYSSPLVVSEPVKSYAAPQADTVS